MSAAADLLPTLGSPGTPVILTGGASGIGLASARALAAIGRKVALWDIDRPRAAVAAAAAFMSHLMRSSCRGNRATGFLNTRLT